MLTQKEIENNNFLKGAYSDPDNRPDWALYWIRDLIENMEDAKKEDGISMYHERVNHVKGSWFRDFWQHYQECLEYEAMVEEQDKVDTLSLEDLRLQFSLE